VTLDRWKTCRQVERKVHYLLRSAWTPFLARLPESQMQAKEDLEARPDLRFNYEIYSLSDWYKLPGRSHRSSGRIGCSGSLKRPNVGFRRNSQQSPDGGLHIDFEGRAGHSLEY
jgi:hypothetical protein